MWSISTCNMPSLHTFEAAEEFWNDAKPWRNRDKSWRPLDSVRMDHKRLVKTDDGSYACVLYNMALVTYYPDQVELEIDSRVSSSAFCWCVQPEGCHITSTNGVHFWSVRTLEGEHFYRPDKTSLVLLRQPKKQWKLDSIPAKTTEWVYDRKLGVQARKLLKPYTTWYETSKRLGMSLPNVWPSVGATNEGLGMLLEQPERINFLEVANLISTPEHALKAAYIYMGAHTEQVVPFDRLPNRTRI